MAGLILLSSLLALVYVWRVVEVAYFKAPSEEGGAIAEARELGSLFDEARSQIAMAHLAALHRSPRDAVPALLEALDTVERIRQLQEQALGKIRRQIKE